MQPEWIAALRGGRRQSMFAARLLRMRELIGYGDDDAETVRRTLQLLDGHTEEIVERAYGRLLKHPETMAYFSGADGVIDARELSRRKASLRSWISMVLTGEADDTVASFLSEAGRAHTRRGGETSVQVRGRYLLVMTGIIFEEVATTLASEPGHESTPALIAWNKVLMLHLDVLLAVLDAAQGANHWY